MPYDITLASLRTDVELIERRLGHLIIWLGELEHAAASTPDGSRFEVHEGPLHAVRAYIHTATMALYNASGQMIEAIDNGQYVAEEEPLEKPNLILFAEEVE